jgi:hypothetical protein
MAYIVAGSQASQRTSERTRRLATSPPMMLPGMPPHAIARP